MNRITLTRSPCTAAVAALLLTPLGALAAQALSCSAPLALYSAATIPTQYTYTTTPAAEPLKLAAMTQAMQTQTVISTYPAPAPNVVATYAIGSAGLQANTGLAGLLPYSGLMTQAAALDASAGYQVSWTMAVTTENHSGVDADKNADGLPDRAGVAAIFISSDYKQSIELAFHTDRVFAQTVGATPTTGLFNQPPQGPENQPTDTTGMNQYTLVARGASYTLYKNGSLLLTGPLRNYGDPAAASYPAAIAQVYQSPNYFFIGDATTSASAQYTLGAVNAQSDCIQPAPRSVPNLTPWGLAALTTTLALAGLRGRRKRHTPS